MKTETTKKFNEQDAIRLTAIARPIIKDDLVAAWASDEDKLIYEHFFIRGMEHFKSNRAKVICYCGSLRVAMDAFKKAEYEAVLRGEIALLPCCMFVDIEREYGAESDYKIKADELHKRKIDICDEVHVLNVNGYIGESTRSEINYAYSIGKPVVYLNDEGTF